MSTDQRIFMAYVQLKFGTLESEWVHDRIANWWMTAEDDEGRPEFEYIDNERLMIIGDEATEDVYEEAERMGCCGNHSVEFGPSPSGNKYVFGFNYGH